MAYVKIEADEKRVRADIEGTPLRLMGILGTTTMECLEKIIEDIPAPFAGETALAFVDTLRLQAMCKWGGREKSDKTAEDKQPEQKPEEPKKPTPEEVLEMMSKLDSEGTKKLLELQMQKMVNSLWAKDQPKKSEEKEPAVGYGVLL